MECLICNSIMVRDKAAECSLDLMSSKTVYEIYRCTKCGYRRLDPFPSDDELSSFYNSDYFEDTARGYSYAEQVVEYNPVFAVTAGKFSKYLEASGTVVDVGCATGEFILFLKKEGFHAVGIELSQYCVDICLRRGLDVIHGDIFDKNTDQWRVQGVHMSHVLEHLRNPRTALLRVHQWLNPGGMLYIEVPLQFDGWLEKLQRLRGVRPSFGAFSLHHSSFFSPKSLLLLLDQCGFDVVNFTTYRKERHASVARGYKRMLLGVILSVANYWRRGDIIGVWAKAR